MSVLQPACGNPVRNPAGLRRTSRPRAGTVEGVQSLPEHSPGFSTPRPRSWSGPSEVLRMIRSPYSYNL